jgi:hypothetical protein
MPRDGTQTYVLPSPDVEEDTTIESAVYNLFCHDVAQDLNTPRPISSGGTGASNAVDAITNMGGEVAKQVVTNFDSHTFKNGSFYSAAGAINAPTTNAFVGTYYENNNGSGAMLQARDLTNGYAYVRAKVANVWMAWAFDVGFPTTTTTDMWFGLSGVAPNSQFVINSEGDATGINLFVVTKISGAFSFNAPANTAAQLYINANGATSGSNIWGMKNNAPRWILQLGNEVAEGGGNSGANFAINRYSDIGVYLGTPLTIDRASGTWQVAGLVNFNSAVALNGQVTGPIITNSYVMSAQSATTGVYYIGNNAAKYIACVGGTNIDIVGAPLAVYNAIYSLGTGGVNGAVWSNSAGTAGMVCDGSNTLMRAPNGGGVYFQDGATTATWGSITLGGFLCNGHIYCMSGYVFSRSTVGANAHFITQDEGGATRTLQYWDRSNNSACLQLNGAATSIAQLPGASVRLGNGLVGKSGYDGGYSVNTMNFQYSSIVECWVNSTYMGQVAFVSDYRTKKDVAALPDMWDTVKALRPISYTQKEFSPPSHKAHIAEQERIAAKSKADGATTAPEPPGPLFVADNIERWGFAAHELQATLTPSAASGVKDDPNAIQSPNPWTVIAALTKALQEAMLRIEALEAR